MGTRVWNERAASIFRVKIIYIYVVILSACSLLRWYISLKLHAKIRREVSVLSRTPAVRKRIAFYKGFLDSHDCSSDKSNINAQMIIKH